MSQKMGPGFEWFVAWRHLRDPERRSRAAVSALVVGLSLLMISAAVLIWLHYFPPRPSARLLRAQVENLRLGAVIGVASGGLIAFIGGLRASFTLFTTISIFGVFLGTAAPILALSVMSGFEMDLKGKIRGAKADVVITSAEDQPFLDWRDVRDKVARVPGVVAATPYLEAEVMVRSGASPAGIILRGLDVKSAGSVLDLSGTIRGGGSLDDLAHPERIPDDELNPGDPSQEKPHSAKDESTGGEGGRQAKTEPSSGPLPTILLGEELYARTLRVFQGSRIDVVCPLCKLGPTGPMPGMKTFKVAGHFYSGMYEFDSKLAYISLEEAQKFLGMPGEVTGIDVRTANPDHAPRVANAIAGVLGKNYDVRSWEELNKGLFMALRLEKIAMFVALTFILLVASFSIVSTLIMMATEKAREIAILKAMGAGDGGIQRVFVAEGVYIGLIGLAVGVTTGVVGCILIQKYGLPLPTDVYYISKLPVVMRPSEILVVAASALGLCCLATVYPALLAARMRPADGLRYE
jgi:lipoprotein-releasing system permease protein